MRLHFKGRPITKERVGWWLRIALTRVFGRNVFIEGRPEPLKLLPWIHRGQVLLMGAERDLLQIRFSNQYTLEIQSAPVISLPEPGGNEPIKATCHVILCHQSPEVVDAIYSHHRRLSSKYHLVIAYGGTRENFGKISTNEKIFIEDASLRGPSKLMSHYELLEKTLKLSATPDETRFFFSEGDLLPLQTDYLDPAIEAMVAQGVGFLGKSIRNITASNNVFLTDAMQRGLTSNPTSEQWNGTPQYLHCLGCFFAVDGAILATMIEQCRLMNGLYFEVMFPTAAARTGARLLSMDSISDYLSDVRYRPFHSAADAAQAAASGIHLIHPVRNEDLMAFLTDFLPAHPGNSPSRSRCCVISDRSP